VEYRAAAETDVSLLEELKHRVEELGIPGVHGRLEKLP